MKPTPLSDVPEHPADAIIYSVRGTLKTVYPRKSGEIKKGPNAGSPWSLQNLELTDDRGTVVPAVLKDRPDEIPKSWQNREVLFEAHKGDKGWSGVYAFDDDYTSPAVRKIKVTATGQISLVDASNEQPPPAKPQQAPPPRTSQAAVNAAREGTAAAQQPPPRTGAATTPHVPGSKSDIAEIVSKANQIANLQLLCLTTTAEYTAARFKEKSGRELTTQEIHAMATSMCIELYRSASYTKMPTTRMGQHPPATPQMHGEGDSE
jgi:hypothetical protein